MICLFILHICTTQIRNWWSPKNKNKLNLQNVLLKHSISGVVL